MDNRKYMGENKEGAIFPIAPNFPEMSGNYLEFIEEIKNKIRRQRVYVVLNANYSMIYTDMGIDPFRKTKQRRAYAANYTVRQLKFKI